MDTSQLNLTHTDIASGEKMFATNMNTRFDDIESWTGNVVTDLTALFNYVTGTTAVTLKDGSTAATQSAGNNTTKVATTAFVTSAIAAAVASLPAVFGDWTNKDNGGSTLVKATTYSVSSDGFVCAYVRDTNAYLALYTDSSSPPTTKRSQDCGYSDAGVEKSASVMSPVKSGDNWKIESNGTPFIYWLPMGTGVCS